MFIYLTIYILSEHSLLKKVTLGRPGSQEKAGYVHTVHKMLETELHFLTSCQMYDHIIDTDFPQITHIHKEFENKPNFDKLPYLLGEIPQCVITAARFVLPQEKGHQ